MRNRRTVVFAIAVALFATGVGLLWAQYAVSRAQFTRVIGTVKVQRSGQAAWLKVTDPVHKHLYAGDSVQTLDRSSCAITVDGAIVNLGPATKVIIPGAAGDPNHKRVPQIWAVFGKVFIWLLGGRQIELGSDAAIAGAEGTKFLVEVAADGAMVLTVMEGAVEFHNDLGRVMVQANQQSTALPGTAPTRPIQVDPSGLIDWEASIDSLWLNWEMRFAPGEDPERLRELLQDARERTGVAPLDVGALLREGDLLHDLGRATEAGTVYARALELDPGNVDAQLRVGVALLTQGRVSEALRALQAVAEAPPVTPEASVMLAAAYASGANDQDLARAREVLAGAPEHPLVAAMTGLVNIRSGDAVAAHADLQRAVALDETCYQAHAHLALVELAGGNLPAAQAAALRARELAPSSALALESLATVQFFAGEHEAARESAARVLLMNPNSAGANLLLSDIAVANGDLDEGLRLAQLAVTFDPRLAPAYSALGMIYLSGNDLGAAEKAFADAVRLRPQLVAARTGMGVTYARQGRLAEGMQMHKAAIAMDSSLASARNNAGAIHLARGELDEALAAFDETLALRPGFALAHANRAIALLDLNRFADAVDAAQEAVKLGGESARTHTTLARCYLEQQRDGRALAEARRAIELDEGYALAHLELAEAYLRQDRARDALRHQLRGISRQPAGMLQTREYARTEITLDAGSFYGNITTDGRADARGRSSYYASVTHEQDDFDRTHTDVRTTSVAAIGGRQNGVGSTDSLLLTWQREDRDRPGARLPGGGPEDVDYTSDFEASQARYLGRRRSPDGTDLTLSVGWTNVGGEDTNPDSLMGDPKPYRRLSVDYEGPTVEARLDLPAGRRGSAIAGLALSGEERTVSGVLGTPNPPGASTPVTWTPFSDTQSRGAATGYLWYKRPLGPATEMLAGGRIATTRSTSPVARPEAYLRQKLADGGVLVLLTRPVLRDDVSEISPVMDWALRDWISPLDLATGGYSQSYELQYERLGQRDSLLRLAAYHRDMKNLIVDLADPAWATGQVGLVLASGTLSGAELEWERWLGNGVTAGVWVRYTDSENEDAGGKLPYQPEITGIAHVDYMDRAGHRVRVRWVHVGDRWADFANAVELGAYDVVDIALFRQLDLHTDVFVTVENLLGESYGYWQGYPEPGRRVRGGVQYRF